MVCNRWTIDIEFKIKEVKQEIKDRKKWVTVLRNQYSKTNDFYERQYYMDLIQVAWTIIRHNENILKEYNEMLKEVKKIFLGGK